MIGLSFVATAILASFLPSITADFASDSYLLPGDQTRQRFDDFRERFGRDERTVVALEPKNVFDLDFLATLRDLHHEIETEVPFVEDVLSLVNARNTRGEEDELIVEDLLEEWPETPEALAALKSRVLANTSYRDTLISRDGRYTVILIRFDTYSSLGLVDDAMEGFDGEGVEREGPEFLTNHEVNQALTALYELVARYESEDLTIRLAGEGVLGKRATELGSQGAVLFASLSMGVVLIVLLVLFRRISAALLPILMVVLSLVSTFGAMAALGIPFSIPTQIIPSFLIAVGICDAIHVQTIFYQAFDRGESKQACVVHALGHSGLAVVLTSLTTAGGLMSFLAAEIAPVARLGMIAPIGVILTLILALTLLPALLVVSPLRRKSRSPDSQSPGTGILVAAMVRWGGWVQEHPKSVLLAAGLLVIVASDGVSRLRFSHDPLDWLLPEDPVRIAVARMDEALNGVTSVEILVDAGEENGLYDPEFLRRIEAAARFAESQDQGPVPIGKATSILEILREINQALNANDPAQYRIPETRELIAQELLLFENSGSDDLLQVTDSLFRTARMTLKVPLVDGFFYGPFLANLESGFRETLGPDLEFEMTGATVLTNRAFSVVLVSMARSYGLALVIITPLMILMIGSLRLGLLSMIPNLLPVYLTLAIMGWLDIALGMSTLLVGSIVIGLAVDDTIHFLHKFDRYHKLEGSVSGSVRRTLETTGIALLTTSVVLALSFGTYYLGGSMTGIVYFGILTSFGTIVAFFADLTLSPALVALAYRSAAP